MSKRPGRRPKPARNLAHRPARSYAPTTVTWGLNASFQSQLLNGEPWYQPWAAPFMLRDPMVRLAVDWVTKQVAMAEFEVRSADRDVAGFVQNTVKKFWRNHAATLLGKWFVFGYSPGVHDFDRNAKGEWVYAKTRHVTPTDAEALRFKESGEFAGFRVMAGLGKAEEGDDEVKFPHAFWLGGVSDEQLSAFHDAPPLRMAYTPWLEKVRRGGATHSRRLFYRMHAFRGLIFYHPPGHVNEADENSPLNRDYADHMAALSENGTHFIIPDTRRAGDGETEPKWRVESVQSNPAPSVDILEYVENLDKEILKAIGIPPELIEAAETGSGFSGRQIPMMAFLASLDARVGPLLAAFEPAVRELVRLNYGDVEFSLEAVPLGETVKKLNNPQAAGGAPGDPIGGGAAQADGAATAGTGGGGPDLPAGGPAPAGGGEDSGGGGDPTGGGLVPYIGKKGGRGKKNPVTGRVTYLSHAGTKLGCLLAEIPEPLADACRSFAATIPDKELAEDGRENQPHVTIRHGFHGVDASPVLNAVAPLGSLSFRPGKLAVFENDDADVLYVSCDDATKWRKWHLMLDRVPNEQTHAGYVPHLTLAYLKRGKGKQYAGKTVLKGDPVPVPRVTYCGPDGREHHAAVWPNAEELAEAFREAIDPVHLAWHAARSSHGTLRADWDGEGGIDKKSQYGENARRALAGDSLIARRPGQDAPIAEQLQTAKKLPVAERLPMPTVKQGQKLVKATDYRDGMEPPGGKAAVKPPAAQKPAPAMAKPAPASATQPPPVKAKVVTPPPAKPAPAPVPVKAKAKPPEPPKPAPAPAKPVPKSAPPTTKKPTGDAGGEHIDVRKALADAGGDSDKALGDIRKRISDHLAAGGKAHLWMDGKRIPVAKVDNDRVYDDQGRQWGLLPMAMGMPGTKSGVELVPPATKRTTPTPAKPAPQPAPKPQPAATPTPPLSTADQVKAGFDKLGEGLKEASDKKTMADVAKKGHTAFRNPRAADMFAADHKDWVREEVDGEHRFRPPAPKPAEDTSWHDEYRELQNRHDDGRIPLKPAESGRLAELQKKMRELAERLKVASPKS